GKAEKIKKENRTTDGHQINTDKKTRYGSSRPSLFLFVTICVSLWFSSLFPLRTSAFSAVHYFAFAPKQYNVPSVLPITNLPSAIAGEAIKSPPASYSQTFFPVLRSSSYSRPSEAPTNTRSPTITGEESTRDFARNFQSSSP